MPGKRKTVPEELSLEKINELVFGVTRIFKEMPEIEKQLLILYYYEGLNLAEIAEVMGVSGEELGTIHRKALAKLQNRLTEIREAILNQG